MILTTLTLLLFPSQFPFAARELHELHAPIGRLKIIYRGTSGPIKIQTGFDQKIVLKELIRADKLPKLKEVRLDQSWKENKLNLTIIENFKSLGDPTPSYPGSVNYAPPFIETTLIVPRETDIDIENINANIQIDGITGVVRARSQNGTIEFRAQTNQIDHIYAKSFNGQIQSETPIQSASSATVSLESYSGQVIIKKPLAPLHLVGAQVFGGKGFSAQDWYIVDGRFTKIVPNSPVQSMDMSGKYLVPPYADAHCHHIDGAYPSKRMNDQYLSEGTLYVQSMGNHVGLRAEDDAIVNRSNSIDVAFANAGFTGDFGHPAFLYESLAHPSKDTLTPKERSDFVRAQPRVMLGDAYWIADSPAQLEDVWPKYLASDPDLTKVFLVDTAARKDNVHGLAGAIGLAPKMVTLVVKKAHAAGLRVYAHVDTAEDFRIAIEAGVDGTAHMPGYGMNQEKAEKFSVTPSIAALAKNLTIQPTISLADIYTKGNALPEVRKQQTQNVKNLLRVGAKFVLGSDEFFRTQISEALSWQAVGFSSIQILNSLTKGTPQSIFPHRMIGRIDEGYEGSFSVLDKDPLFDLSKAFAPLSVYKKGMIVFSKVAK